MKLKPLLKSAVTFHPTKVVANERLRSSVVALFEWASELAEVSGEHVGVTMQHSLKHDAFALMLECGPKTFSSHSGLTKNVFEAVSKKVFKHIEELHAAVEKKEHLAGKKSGRRYRRKGPTRFRRSSPLQERCS